MSKKIENNITYLRERSNPYESLVYFINRHRINAVEEQWLREIIKRIIEWENSKKP